MALTKCAGCGREMKLSQENALWRNGDGTIYGWCCYKQAAADTKKEETAVGRPRPAARRAQP